MLLAIFLGAYSASAERVFKVGRDAFMTKVVYISPQTFVDYPEVAKSFNGMGMFPNDALSEVKGLEMLETGEEKLFVENKRLVEEIIKKYNMEQVLYLDKGNWRNIEIYTKGKNAKEPKVIVIARNGLQKFVLLILDGNLNIAKLLENM